MQVDARRVHISVDDAVRVEMRDCRGQLAEKAQGLECGEFSLAELLPARDVVGALGAKN